MDACNASCGWCGRCTASWDYHDRQELDDMQPEVIDPIALAERNALEAVTEMRDAVNRCETVAQVLALKVRISALWLAWDALDQDVLRKADRILNEAVELHSTKVA